MVVQGGNFSTEVDELELGHRVTSALDSEGCWGATGMLFWYSVEVEELEAPTEDDGWDGEVDFL